MRVNVHVCTRVHMCVMCIYMCVFLCECGVCVCVCVCVKIMLLIPSVTASV